MHCLCAACDSLQDVLPDARVFDSGRAVSWLQLCGSTSCQRRAKPLLASLKTLENHPFGLLRAQTLSTRHDAGIKVKTLELLNDTKSSDTDTFGVVRLFDPFYYPGSPDR